MRKLIIIWLFVCSGLMGQSGLLNKNKGVIRFQGGFLVIPDTTEAICLIGAGVEIGAGIEIGACSELSENLIELPEQYMKKEETEENLIS